MGTFVHFYFMKRDVEGIGEAIPEHAAYWHSLELAVYMGGPFSDRSGGLIIFNAVDLESAQEKVGNDPFVTRNLIETGCTKEWNPE